MAEKDDVGGGSGLSDEEWAEFEKQFTAEAAKTAAYKEPSARQRELTAKWKQEAPTDTGWRTDGPGTPTTPRVGRPQLTVLPGGKRRRAWRRNLAWTVAAVLVTGAVIGSPKLFSSSKDGSPAPPNAGAPTSTAPGAGAPTTAPSPAAGVNKPWPAIDAKTAFPAAVKGPAGDSLKLVTTNTTTSCAPMTSQALGDLIQSGTGCQQLTEGLYTDGTHRTQYTVAVLTMKRAEDAGTIFATAKTQGLDYQVVSLDAPAGSGVPIIPAGAPGYTTEVMAVRSVVFVMGQYSDGGDHDVKYVSQNADVLLGAVDDKVAGYESSR